MDTAAPNINLSAVRAVDIPEKIAFSPDGSWELTDQLSESRPLRSPVTVGGCLLCCVGSQRGREGCLGVFSAERPAKVARPDQLSRLQGGAPAGGGVAGIAAVRWLKVERESRRQGKTSSEASKIIAAIKLNCINSHFSCSSKQAAENDGTLSPRS
jgi:hypothetical protein